MLVWKDIIQACIYQNFSVNHVPVHVILGILSRGSIQTHFVPKELTSSCKWCLLGLYLNLFRLVVLLIFSGTLFHNVGQMKDKALWPVLVLQTGYWRFWYSLSLKLKFVDYAYTLHLDVAYIISFVELGGNWSIVSEHAMFEAWIVQGRDPKCNLPSVFLTNTQIVNKSSGNIHMESWNSWSKSSRKANFFKNLTNMMK